MKIVKKNVYYCEFCGKHSLRSLKIHEEHCTLNPNRKCRLCNTETLKLIIDKYSNRYKIVEVDSEYNVVKVEWLNGEVKIEDIIKDCGNCPNCVLTILRLTKMNRYLCGLHYDYKKALEDFWHDRNAEEENPYL